MKMPNKWSARTAVIAFTTTCLLGGVVVAATVIPGDKNDPLVSLSYFENRILPDLLKDAEGEAEDVRDDMLDDFDDKISDYEKEIVTLVEGVEDSLTGAQSSAAAAYSVITLQPGETLSLDAGDEVMLRIGSATITGGTPALISTTAATELSDGSSLVKNQLYLCTINGRTLTAGDSETWVLVRQ